MSPKSRSRSAHGQSRRAPHRSKKPSCQALMSAAAAQIAQEALKEEVTIQDLSQMAMADAAFAMKLLALVNSPAFARAQPVTDIKHAAALLGIRGLRTVALSLLVSTLCPPSEGCRILMANSLRRAVACKLVGKHVDFKDLDGCFATGLFLDSGLLGHPEEQLATVLAIASGPAHHRVLRELAENLEPHPQAGARLAKSYGLPDDTIGAILHHHDDRAPEEALAQIAWLAESVAGVFENPHVDNARRQALAKAAHLGVNKATVDSILEELPSVVAEIAAALKRDVGVIRDIEELRSNAGSALSEINQQYEGVIRKLGELIKEKELLTEELRQANRTLENMAHTDVLTGLCNRRALEDHLERCAARAQRDNAWLGIIAIDIDHFKKFNDTHGHAAGDAVLEKVGEIMQEESRKGDVPARYGGEEFTVVLPSTDEAGTKLVAERMRQRMEACETLFEGRTLKMTASFGATSVRGSSIQPIASLMTAADKALYVAKREGRNRVRMAPGVPASQRPSRPPQAA